MARLELDEFVPRPQRLQRAPFQVTLSAGEPVPTHAMVPEREERRCVEQASVDDDERHYEAR